MNSTHKVEVVPVQLEPHPNADSLSIVRVFGYQVVVRTSDWQDEHVAAYIPPDSLVDMSRPQFAFLQKPGGTNTHHRIRAIKLRGVQSFGMLAKAPVGAMLGDDVAEQLGVIHYEPPLETADMGGETVAEPSNPAPIYDLESGRRYVHCFNPGQMVYVTEKIHGTSARYVFQDGVMHVGSRRQWLAESDNNLYWRALRNTPRLEEFCHDNPGSVVYGEVYGWVQSLRYGHRQGQYSFAAFDILHDGRWLNHTAARSVGKHLPWVPSLSDGPIPFYFDDICAMAEGKTTIIGADHVREGVVVVPEVEQWDSRIGRVKLKIVGPAFCNCSGNPFVDVYQIDTAGTRHGHDTDSQSTLSPRVSG